MRGPAPQPWTLTPRGRLVREVVGLLAWLATSWLVVVWVLTWTGAR